MLSNTYTINYIYRCVPDSVHTYPPYYILHTTYIHADMHNTLFAPFNASKF